MSRHIAPVARNALRANRRALPPVARPRFDAAFKQLCKGETIAPPETRIRAAKDYVYLQEAITAHKNYRLAHPSYKTTYREYIKKSAQRCGLVPPTFWDEDPNLPSPLKPKNTDQKQIFEFQER